MSACHSPASPSGSASLGNPAELPILHVDMDAFFAEAERLEDPSLIGRAVIVGGSGRRGVVASASYEARAFGVHAAMPVGQARRLCPNAVFVSPTAGLYAAATRTIRKVFESFTPLVEMVSLDEAFLDISGAHALFGTSEQIAWGIRSAVHAATQLDCSIGVASNKTLAKMASVAAKPQASQQGTQPGLGVCAVPVSQQLQFLHSLPVKALWGVGRVTEKRLVEMGVATIGDLAAIPPAALTEVFGVARGEHLTQLAQGIDERPIQVSRGAKSLGHEETFATDVNDVAVMRSKVTQLSDSVAWRLRRAGVAGRLVQLKVKLADFTLKTRETTLPSTAPSVDTAVRIADVAMVLLKQLLAELNERDTAKGVRLIGVSVAHLEPSVEHASDSGDSSVKPYQLMLDLGDSPDNQPPDTQQAGSASQSDAALTVEQQLAAEQRLAAAVDDIRERFGGAAIGLGFNSGIGDRPVTPREI